MNILRLFRILTFFSAAIVMAACEDPSAPEGIKTDDGQTPGPDNPPVSYVIPDYADDYSSISSWDNHSSWNLANVHDPSIAYYNGYYYMYGTDASYGNEHEKATSGRHFQGKRSKDLVNWTYLPGPMNDAPAWVKDSLNTIRGRMGLPEIEKPSYGYWAPVVRKVTVGGVDKLRMYYCIVVNNTIKKGGTSFDGSWTERAFIGMCESTDPANAKWEDKGFVTCSSSDKGRDGWARPNENDWNAYFYYNAIDPTYIVTPEGKHYLIHGSWHSGFSLLQIDPESGKPVDAPLGDPWADDAAGLTARYGVRIGTRTASSRWQGSEAPEIIYKDGYYYLFMAYDGLDVPYNTRVVRSQKIEGPYTDITGRNFTNGRGDCYPIVTHPYRFKSGFGWVGISHCCIFQQEGTGDWFYCSQGRLPAGSGGNAYSNAIMMGHVRRIVWCPSSASTPDDLWPIALPERYAGLPKGDAIKKTDLVGKWEHINLKYDYGKMDLSSDLILNSDGTMSGALTGNWSYDENKKQLKLGDVIVCVEREADWEASPRVATIVYAGTEKSLNATYWGKKVSD
jgi:arabinan endo-1,5-alpha-L-arabinosidase